LYNKHKGTGGNSTSNSVADEANEAVWAAQGITGQYRIDIGLRRRPQEEFFLKGPVPLSVLLPVGKMPGKTLIVYLLIVHRVTVMRENWVTLPTYILKEWGISRDARTDALKRLEQTKLIATRRRQGGYLNVQLIRKPTNWKPK
jgi:hypothetical protein